MGYIQYSRFLSSLYRSWMSGQRIVSICICIYIYIDGWCSSLVHRVDSTKSHPVFIHKTDSSSVPPSLPPLPVSPCISISPHFHLLFSCCCHQGNRQFKKLLLSNGRQYPASAQRGSEREGERETFQSVNKALLLPSNQPWPPPPSPSPSPNRLAVKSTQ